MNVQKAEVGPLIVECPRCNATMLERPRYSYGREDERYGVETYSLIACPTCEEPLLVNRAEASGWEPFRLFPPTKDVSTKIPVNIGVAYAEARRCLSARCARAAALMCRATLEALTRHQGCHVRNNLSASLRKLHENKVIDDRLLEWAMALHQGGNLAAHEDEPGIEPEDARDMVEFVEAILDYVFVLHARFEEYKRRRTATAERKVASPAQPEHSNLAPGEDIPF
jgi:hypothetical protein